MLNEDEFKDLIKKIVDKKNILCKINYS